MNTISRTSARRALFGLLLLLPLSLPACSLTPCVTKAIGSNASLLPLDDDAGTVERVAVEVGRTGLLVCEVAALPCAFAIDVAAFPLTFLWLVWTFGGHGDPPFGCR